MTDLVPPLFFYHMYIVAFLFMHLSRVCRQLVRASSIRSLLDVSRVQLRHTPLILLLCAIRCKLTRAGA
jgi:hypothetical protein